MASRKTRPFESRIRERRGTTATEMDLDNNREIARETITGQVDDKLDAGTVRSLSNVKLY